MVPGQQELVDAESARVYQYYLPGVHQPHAGTPLVHPGHAGGWVQCVPAPAHQALAVPLQQLPGVAMMQPMNAAIVSAPMGGEVGYADQLGMQQVGLSGLGNPAARPGGPGGHARPLYRLPGGQQPRSRLPGGLWGEAPAGYGRLAPAALGQATSVEDILQLLRSMPRGSSAIPVVADSLRYLDSRALAALLKELSKTGMRELAFEIFDWLRSLDKNMHPEYMGLLDVFTYTTMIAQCTNHMHLPTALELVAEMRTRNVALNTHTYSSMLNVCVKAGKLDLALDVFNQMLAEGLTPNLVTYNTLLEVYAKRGMWAEAVGVLDTLEQQRLVPEPRTYNIVMNACNAASQFASCIAVHTRMAEHKVPPTIGTYNAVILAHCKLDQLASAQALFSEMQAAGCQPTHTSFITLLQAAETHCQAGVAVALLEQMQGLALRLTPQCYAAAIGACAAAGQLTNARRLLGDMLASSKAGMAAPAHIIMQLQDKCCDWQGAHRTYQKLLASGVRPDSQSTATAIEALWGAGNVASSLLALQVFEAACKAGVFRLAVAVRAPEPAVEFTLPVGGACMGLISLWRLLAELRGRVSRDGPQILRSSVVVLMGDGQTAVPHLQAAMMQLSAVPGMPFDLEAKGHQVVLTAPAGRLADWLRSEASSVMCPVMPPVAELDALHEGSLLEAENVALSRCRQRLLQAGEAERGLVQRADSLPAHYQQARPGLWQQLQSACALLRPQLPQLPFDALVLLDQAAAAGLLQQPDGEPGSSGTPAAGAMPHDWVLAACVLVAAQAAAVNGAVSGGGSAGSAAPPEPAIAGEFGVALEQLLTGASRLREVCGTACHAPVSVFGLLDVYLEALMAGDMGRKVPVASLLGDAHALAAAAVSSPASFGVPANQLAGLLVCAGRQARGLYPVWPKVLVVLTGLMQPAAGEQHQQLLQALLQQARAGGV